MPSVARGGQLSRPGASAGVVVDHPGLERPGRLCQLGPLGVENDWASATGRPSWTEPASQAWPGSLATPRWSVVGHRVAEVPSRSTRCAVGDDGQGRVARQRQDRLGRATVVGQRPEQAGQARAGAVVVRAGRGGREATGVGADVVALVVPGARRLIATAAKDVGCRPHGASPPSSPLVDRCAAAARTVAQEGAGAQDEGGGAAVVPVVYGPAVEIEGRVARERRTADGGGTGTAVVPAVDGPAAAAGAVGREGRSRSH